MHLEVCAARIREEPLDPPELRLLLVAERLDLGGGDLPPEDEANARGVEMNTDHVLGIDMSELGRHEGAEVTTLRAITLVAEPSHEFGPGLRGPGGVRALFMCRAREADLVAIGADRVSMAHGHA